MNSKDMDKNTRKKKEKKRVTEKKLLLSSRITETISKEIDEGILQNKVDLFYEKFNEIEEILHIEPHVSNANYSELKGIATKVRASFRSLEECKETLHLIEKLTRPIAKRRKSVKGVLENINNHRLMLDDYESKLINIENRLIDIMRDSFRRETFLWSILFMFLHLLLSVWLYRNGFTIPFCLNLFLGTYLFWKLNSIFISKVIGSVIIEMIGEHPYKLFVIILISPVVILSLLICRPNNSILPKYETYEAKVDTNIRTGPSMNFPSIGMVKKKEKAVMIMIKKEGNWSGVKINHKEGYIYSKNFQFVESRNKKALLFVPYFLIGGAVVAVLYITTKWVYSVYLLPWIRLYFDKRVIQRELDEFDYKKRSEEISETFKIDLAVEDSKIKQHLLTKIMETYKREFDEIGKSKVISNAEKKKLRDKLKENTIGAIKSLGK